MPRTWFDRDQLREAKADSWLDTATASTEEFLRGFGWTGSEPKEQPALNITLPTAEEFHASAPWRDLDPPKVDPRTSTTSPASGIAPTRQPSAIPGPDLSPESGTPVRSAAEMSGTTGQDYGPIDNSSLASFVKTAFPYMLDAAEGDRDLAELMLAKAINENGDVGSGSQGFIGNNFSGIKGKGSAGSFVADTWEEVNGQRVPQKAEFAAYNTPQEGFRAFLGFLRENSRYEPALEKYQQDHDAMGLIRGIHAAGYATDSAWPEKIAAIRDSQVTPVARGVAAPQSRPAASAPPLPSDAPAPVVTLSTPNIGGRRRSTDGIVIHSTRGFGVDPADEYQKTLEAFADPSKEVSAHAVIAVDGTIAQIGDWDATAWHAGENNASRIGIELVQSAADNDKGVPFTDAQYRSLAWLTGQLSKRYGFGIDRNALVGHEELEQGHRSGKTDPGKSFDWNRYQQEARGYAGQPVAQNAGATPPAASSLASADVPPSADAPLSLMKLSGEPAEMPTTPDQPSDGGVRGYSQDDIRFPGSRPYDVTDDDGVDLSSDQLYPRPLPAQRIPGLRLPVDEMYRQPLGQQTFNDEYDPRDADQGPRESGYVLPPAPLIEDDPGTQPVGAVNGPIDPWTQPNPEIPGSVRASDLPARPGQDDRSWRQPPAQQQGGITIPDEALDRWVPRYTQQPAPTPQEVPVQPARFDPRLGSTGVYRQEPAEDAAAEIERDRQYQPGAPSNPLEQAVAAVGRSQFLRETAGEQAVSIYEAIQSLPFDAYAVARRQLISDLEAKHVTGIDPIAPLRAMFPGVPWPSVETLNPDKRPAGDVLSALLIAGAMPDPADPLVQTAFRGLGVARRGGLPLAAAGAGAVAGALAPAESWTERGKNAAAAGAAGLGVGLAGPAAVRAAPGAARAVGRGAYALGEEAAYQATFGPMSAARRIVPPSVADTLDFPVRVPDDPATIRAIEAAGGTVDPEKGVTMNVIRNQDPEAHGGVAVRGAAFYIAGPPGTPNPYARSAGAGGHGTGGTDRIEGWTRFRSPLILDAAPGEARGFDDAMRQFGLLTEENDNWRGLPMANAGPSFEEINRQLKAIYSRTPAGSAERVQAVKDLVSKYGGDPDLVEPALTIRGPEHEETYYGIRENILAANARKQGYDGVVTVKPTDAPVAAVAAHPQVVAAVDAEKQALRAAMAVDQERAAAQAAGADWQQLTVIDAKRDNLYAEWLDAQIATKSAQEAANAELRGAKITELMDPREARNPTPGASREVSLADTATQLDEARKEWRRLAADMQAGRGDPAALDQAMARVAALEQDYDTVLRTGSQTVHEPSGFTLRDDVKPAAQRAAEAAEDARLEAIADQAFNDPVVQAAGRRAQAAEDAYQAIKASGDNAAIDAASSERSAAFAEHARLQHEAYKRIEAAQGATTPQNAAIPFDPSSAAAGGAAGAMSGDEGEEPDPGRTAAGMAVAGLVNFRRFPGVQRALAASQRRAAAMAANPKGPQALSPLQWTRKLVGSVGYSSMIGPSTATVNVFGNLLEPLWAAPKEVTRALLPRALGGRGAPREAAEMAFGAFHGLTQTWGAVKDALMARGRYAPNPDSPSLSAQTINPVGHAIAAGLEVGGRVFSGMPDAIFGTIARGAGEARRAAQIATDEGLKGPAWQQRVKTLLGEVEQHKAGQLTVFPSEVDDIIKSGERYSDQQTFREELGTVGKGASALAGRNVPVLGNLITPFFNTPWNMGLTLAERTPIGLAMNRRQGFDKAYDALVGSVLVTGLVVGPAAAGRITGSGPDDPEKRKMLEADGWKPYHTLTTAPDGKDYYVPNRVFGIYGKLLNAVGDAHDAMAYQKKGADPRDVGNDALKRIGNLMKQEPYLQGISDLLELLGDRSMPGLERYAASTATRMVPYGATARTIGTAMDPSERETDRGKGVSIQQSVAQKVQQGLGARTDLPVAQNVLGQPKENQQQGAWSVLPRMAPKVSQPLVRAYLDGGVDIGGPPADIDGVKLTPQQQRRYRAVMGQELQRIAGPTVTGPTWANMPPQVRKTLLETFQSTARTLAETAVSSEGGTPFAQERAKATVDKALGR